MSLLNESIHAEYGLNYTQTHFAERDAVNKGKGIRLSTIGIRFLIRQALSAFCPMRFTLSPLHLALCSVR